jgi:chemotaxis protein CheD
MEMRIGMGEYRVAGSPHILVAIGLGSCVAVVLYDKCVRVGGLAHIVLPAVADVGQATHSGRFADFAVPEMIRQMQINGSSIRAIEATVVGGANMFPAIIDSTSTMNVGLRNVLEVRHLLAGHGIRIVGEHTGRSIGRSVSLDTRDGSVVVRTARVLRGAGE